MSKSSSVLYSSLWFLGKFNWNLIKGADRFWLWPSNIAESKIPIIYGNIP